jgi:N-acetylglucosamine-6-phosphate deacetylase
MLGLDLAAASRLASRTPAAFLGLDGAMGVIAPGARADLVHLDEALRPLATWIGGSAE